MNCKLMVVGKGAKTQTETDVNVVNEKQKESTLGPLSDSSSEDVGKGGE